MTSNTRGQERRLELIKPFLGSAMEVFPASPPALGSRWQLPDYF